MTAVEVSEETNLLLNIFLIILYFDEVLNTFYKLQNFTFLSPAYSAYSVESLTQTLVQSLDQPSSPVFIAFKVPQV